MQQTAVLLLCAWSADKATRQHVLTSWMRSSRSLAICSGSCTIKAPPSLPLLPGWGMRSPISAALLVLLGTGWCLMLCVSVAVGVADGNDGKTGSTGPFWLQQAGVLGDRSQPSSNVLPSCKVGRIIKHRNAWNVRIRLWPVCNGKTQVICSSSSKDPPSFPEHLCAAAAVSLRKYSTTSATTLLTERRGTDSCSPH